MGDRTSIEKELDENLKSYSSNKLLNKLTPGKRRNQRMSKDDSDISLSHNSSSLKRATSQSQEMNSRRITPRKSVIKGKLRNDSNIVTSPVKTLSRRTREDDLEDSSSDEFEPTTTFDQKTRSQLSAATIPLNDKPKSPIRKGTPKLKKTSNVLDQDNSKLVLESMKSRSFNGNSSKKIIPDDEFDDDEDFDIENKKASETLLDDIPSDLLSPEKHQYPEENLTRSSLNGNRSIYPKLPSTVDLLKSKSPINQKKKIPSSSPAVDLLRSSKTPDQFGKSKAPILPNDFASSSIQRPIGRSTSRPASKQPSLHSTPIIANKSTNSTNILSIFNNEYNNPPSASKIPIYSHNSSHSTIFNNPNNSSSDHNSSVLIKKSPAKRVIEAQKTIERIINNIEDFPEEPKSTISKYDSEEEELEVPEMTSTKFGRLIDTNEIKRKHAEIEIFQDKEQEIEIDSQPLKKQRLYPDLNNLKEVKVQTEIEIDEIENPQIEEINGQSSNHDTNIESRPSLYPNLPKFKSQTSEVANKLKSQPQSQQQPQQQPQYRSQLTPQIERNHEEEDLGDSDNWNRSQWKRFLKAFRKYSVNFNDLGYFTPTLLNYLKCDINEIKSKIQFVKSHEEQLRNGFRKEY